MLLFLKLPSSSTFCAPKCMMLSVPEGDCYGVVPTCHFNVWYPTLVPGEQHNVLAVLRTSDIVVLGVSSSPPTPLPHSVLHYFQHLFPAKPFVELLPGELLFRCFLW